ncbi:hypothetical protein FACS1894137_07190 [Spirochaetia bacterium]|nr:hypothetical protein FACS1894137_07190 [Spirochaetia bacterium]
MLFSFVVRLWRIMIVVCIGLLFSCQNPVETQYVEVPVEVLVEVPVEVPIEIITEITKEVPIVNNYEFDINHPEDLPVGETVFLSPFIIGEDYTGSQCLYYYNNYNEFISKGYNHSDGWGQERTDYDLGEVPSNLIYNITNMLLNFGGTYLTHESDGVFVVTYITISYRYTSDYNKVMMLKVVYKNFYRKT